MRHILVFCISLFVLVGCEVSSIGADEQSSSGGSTGGEGGGGSTGGGIAEEDSIDPARFYNYENQDIPDYIAQVDTNNDGIPKDNTGDNPITDAGATLGRVLFYDQNLSADNTKSCASCHQQQFAFSDSEIQSDGIESVAGVTGRSSMRLVNIRFNESSKFFWDERADTLEQQATMPIRDHIEMGFNGCDVNADQEACDEAAPDFDDLITKLSGIEYYETLFTEAFGDTTITEERMQLAMAQFQRSIISFDTPYDEALTDYMDGSNYNVPVNTVNNLDDDPDFPMLTASENRGKALFMTLPAFDMTEPADGQSYTGNRISGGLGCHACHIAPEFDIDIVGPSCVDGTDTDGQESEECLHSRQKNNGLKSVAGDPGSEDDTNTRAPSIRDLGHFDDEGLFVLNGPMFHDGSAPDLDAMIEHYDLGISVTAAEIAGIAIGGGEAPKFDTRLSGFDTQALVGLSGDELTALLDQMPSGQRLQMSEQEKDDLKAFLLTLVGTDMYTNPRWSDPFDDQGELQFAALHSYSVSITNTAGDASYTTEDSVTFTFTNSGDDVSNVRWSSNLDGNLGTDNTLQTTLSEGTHTITLTINYADGTQAIYEATIEVTAPGAEAGLVATPNMTHLVATAAG